MFINKHFREGEIVLTMVAIHPKLVIASSNGKSKRLHAHQSQNIDAKRKFPFYICLIGP